MDNFIVCPTCKNKIPLTQALSHQIQEKYRLFYSKRLEEEKKKIEEKLKTDLSAKIKSELELQLKDKINETEELRQQNKKLQEQLLETNKLLRQLKTEKDQMQLEIEKKLAQEQEKIRSEEKKRVDEEYRLKMLEKEKQMEDMRRQIEELKRKSELTSQELQGEVQEEELKNILQKNFPYDAIEDVPKGVKGADLIQKVKNDFGKICGTIIWESKRTKAWSDSWISKLKEDQRQVKAEIAVIISQVLPDDIKNFGLRDGVWIGNFSSVLGVALILRKMLIEVSSVKLSLVGRQEKKEILWNYLTSTQFKQRVEAIYEAYQQMMTDLQKEKDWFRKKWARQEKNIEQISEHILGMHGDLQGIVGRSLPEIEKIKQLEEGDNNKKLNQDEQLF